MPNEYNVPEHQHWIAQGSPYEAFGHVDIV